MIGIDQLHIEEQVVSGFDSSSIDSLKALAKALGQIDLACEYPRVLPADQNSLLVLRKFKLVLGDVARDADLRSLALPSRVDGHVLCLADF